MIVTDIAALVEHEPDLGELIRAVATHEHGAVCTFLGTARRQSEGKLVEQLRYQAYAEMAEKTIGQICRDAEQKFPGARVIAQHRVGECPLGEASVAIVAVAPHRPEAFAACRYGIDEIKARAPIWKQEVYSDGEAWIGGATPVDPESSGEPGPT